MMMRSDNDNNTLRNEDADLSLSELTENSLMISNTQEITKLNTNVLSKPKNGGLYSNGLSTMTSSAEAGTGIETSESSNTTTEDFSSPSGPLGPSCTLALPQADVGLLASSFPDSWSGWECKRREESASHHDTFFKKNHAKNIRNLKRIRRKTLETKKAKVPTSIFRRRRLRMERGVGRKLGCLKKNTKKEECTEIIPFQSSKSLRRRQRRRVVRFVDEEITEWKREKTQSGFGRVKSVGNLETFRGTEKERKENQRTLLDLQVGMKCMGL
eukprot:CAMPEP_0116122590 /NCGR_PEP_ID=MMETSP0329-20121206/4294_1 /TAXON_ID=697910 /ORGANISM="Pseudo-nitzschia arenysensis, Strain B593" /LENGTH=270 /DNA_ID=CAMNT_0003616445 /DNA_START=252 /DNA_END=1064 /DNA_ORIENTATION=+